MNSKNAGKLFTTFSLFLFAHIHHNSQYASQTMISRAGFLFYFLFFTTIFSKRVVKIEQVDFQPVEPQLNNSNIQINSRRLLAVSKKSHKVTGLPGLSKDISFDHYAGHILVDSQKNSNLFYWLFESSKNANDKPLLIWLNGGMPLLISNNNQM